MGIDESVFMKIPYGLYLLTSKNEHKDNGCIINTAVQVAKDKIAISVNKQNYTADMILKTKCFNVSLLTVDTPFAFFENFGFKSGKEADKISYLKNISRTENGIIYTRDCVKLVISAKDVIGVDCGSHYTFIGTVSEAFSVSEKEALTYSYYQSSIKPKPKKNESKKGRIWVCKICGYQYDEEQEGVPFEELPDDWVCLLCKHPKSDFELMV
jgi:flavin reductase (DIM6/NTAB) family NADH-FMN oxidoreductase RutF/rubredoxin